MIVRIESVFGELLIFLIAFFGVTLIIGFIYYVIVPQFTDGRTLGRVLTKTKVVTEKETKPGVKTLFVREIIGNHIIAPILTIAFLIGVFLTALLLRKRGRSIADLISGTKLVNTRVQISNERKTKEV